MPSTELLGICVVYLGGLNYFFAVDEKSPIVSKIGTTDGELHVQITPFVSNVAAAIQSRSVEHEQAPDGGDTNKDDGFVRYARKELDSSEEQVYEYMDRTLQYRVRIDAIHSLKRTRKFSHVFARYAFFKAGSTQTQCQAVTSAQEDGGTDYVSFQHERRFAVDVNDAFVKYVSSSSLMLEVFGCNTSE
ncbi:hypothetical protein Gpo141_00000045 [Globisporangium polare]